MSKVCLTPRQQKFFNYFKNYQEENGTFPTASQACRDLRAAGVRCSPNSVNNEYGVLFLKGAFTGGTPLTQGYRKLHGVDNKPLDLKTLAVKPKAKPAAIPSIDNLDALMQRAIAKYFTDMAAGKAATLYE